MFYFVSVTILLLVAPLCSIAAELVVSHPAPNLWDLAGQWFTFWGAGVRLLAAGVTQVMRPQFTSSSIFGITDPAATAIVREVGFANLAMGTLGVASLLQPDWLLPAALVGALYYGLAGAGHAGRDVRQAKEQFALVSDLAIAALLAAYFVSRAL